MAETRWAAYRVKGSTGDVTTCQQCGRDELRGTVVLAILDAAGNEADVTYMGSSCAARATGWTQADVRGRVKSAQAEARAAAELECRERHEADRAAFCAWVLAEYGIRIRQAADLWEHEKVLGLTPFGVRKVYQAARPATGER
jgi:hypothetical protein